MYFLTHIISNRNTNTATKQKGVPLIYLDLINISYFFLITINTIAMTTYIRCLQSYLMKSLSRYVDQWPHPRSSL